MNPTIKWIVRVYFVELDQWILDCFDSEYLLGKYLTCLEKQGVDEKCILIYDLRK